MLHPTMNALLVATSRTTSFVEIESIVRIEAVSNYSRLHLADGTHIVVAKILKQFEEVLGGKGFERVHRSHLVNMACIKSYNFFKREVILKNMERISMSRRKRSGIRKKLKAA